MEKRKHPRIHVCCPVSFLSFDDLRIGETADLSLGGMRLHSRTVVIQGETYTFTIVVNGRAITPKGRVVYIYSHPELVYRAGISFIYMSEDHKRDLTGFLSSQRPYRSSLRDPSPTPETHL
jgi:c-di-GMP-binding flagellar brake protein YcgR